MSEYDYFGEPDTTGDPGVSAPDAETGGGYAGLLDLGLFDRDGADPGDSDPGDSDPGDFDPDPALADSDSFEHPDVDVTDEPFELELDWSETDLTFDASYDLIGSDPDERGWWDVLNSDHNHDGAYDTVSYDVDTLRRMPGASADTLGGRAGRERRLLSQP